jgi:predicted ATPase/class 3 adenylate cyclase/tetratricopeptide (TPR) repeat protein
MVAVATSPVFPTGTVTFLFTDIEGSSAIWERHPEAMKSAMARHDALLRAAVEGAGGVVVKTTGDGCYAVFETATEAASASLAIQRAFRDEPWVEAGVDPLRLRVGLNTGEAELRDGDYHGTSLNRAARLMSAGHGGQVLLSGATAALLGGSAEPGGSLPDGADLRDLGEYRLRGLSRPMHVHQLVAGDLPADFPPLQTETVAAVNLPNPSTRFVGRAPEVRQIVNLLTDPNVRLLSLVGPGGAGKTRLAIQAAGEVAGQGGTRFPDGIYFVPLAPLGARDSMVTAVAQSVGLRFRAEESPHTQLMDYLRRKRLLLVMDNIEHLLDDGGAALPAEIVETAPGVGILATSRTRLNVQGEHLFPVGGMRAPEPATVHRWREHGADIERESAGYSAIQLFAHCAARVQRGFKLSADNIIDVARICRLVQGLPLGIELAAAWLAALSLPEIAAEIERCFDILSTDQHGIPERQRSIRAVFDSSWELLTADERALLPALSVFRGSFTREAAGSVGGASLRTLLSLVNKSWLQRVEAQPRGVGMMAPVASAHAILSGPSLSGGAAAATGWLQAQSTVFAAEAPASPSGMSGSNRFQTHALLRQYAEEKLAADPAREREARERMAAYYARMLDEALPQMLGRDQVGVFDDLTADFDDIRQVWQWLVAEGRFEVLVDKMLLPLHLYAQTRFLGTDVAPLLDEAIDRYRANPPAADGPDTVLARLLISRADIYRGYYTGEFSPGDIDQAWVIAAQLGPEAPARLGAWYLFLQQAQAYRAHRDEAIANIRAVIAAAPADARPFDPTTRTGALELMTRAFAHQLLAWLKLHEFATEGDLKEAEQLMDSALGLYERLGNRNACATVYGDQAEIAARRGHWDEALELLARSQRLAEAIGNWGAVWLALLARREYLLQRGRPDLMAPVFEEMLELSRTVGNYRLELWTLGWDSIYSLRYGDPREALRHRLEAKAIADEFAIPYEQAWSSWELGEVYRVLGDTAAARQWFETSLPLFQRAGVDLGTGFYWRGLGDLALMAGDAEAAYAHFGRYLEIARRAGFTWSEVYALCGQARAAVDLGRLDEARAGLDEAARLAAGSHRNDLSCLPLAGRAYLAAAEGDAETAGRLAREVLDSPLSWYETRRWVEGLT